MFKALSITVLIIINFHTFAATNFYASKGIQESHSTSFVLSKEAKGFINAVYSSSFKEADEFIELLKSDEDLWLSINEWDTLTLEEQIPILRKVFQYEVQSFNIVAPKLIIDLSYDRAAFFDYNNDLSGAGTVYLNPKLVFEQNKYSSLSLLIHETRHSAQLQKSNHLNGMSYLGYFYKQSFITQKQTTGKLSFCDFLTLNNEYEAFLFGNYVINKITNGKIDIKGMGTFASQFHANGEIKIDLKNLHNDGQGDILNRFNIFEEAQAKRLGIK